MKGIQLLHYDVIGVMLLTWMREKLEAFQEKLM
jgi:hypothetical protein